jgi:uncharacterized membrane protein (DUF2068 family)
VSIAVVLSLLVTIINLISPAFPHGSGPHKEPMVAIILAVVFGVVGIAAAIGLWLLRRWGYFLTLVVTALNLLSMIPGVVFGPTVWIKVLSAVLILVCIAILVLVRRPEARRAYV